MRNVSQIDRPYEHMEKLNSEVIHICPKTGNPVNNAAISKQFAIKRFLRMNKHLPEAFDEYKGILVKNMTDKQIDKLYAMSKEMRSAKQIHII
jgi:hypothetical protein